MAACRASQAIGGDGGRREETRRRAGMPTRLTARPSEQARKIIPSSYDDSGSKVLRKAWLAGVSSWSKKKQRAGLLLTRLAEEKGKLTNRKHSTVSATHMVRSISIHNFNGCSDSSPSSLEQSTLTFRRAIP
jgi:hypothetical protein